MKKILILIVVLVVCFSGGYVMYIMSNEPVPVVPEIPQKQLKLLTKATFICQGGKLIEAGFFEDVNMEPSTSTPPLPPGVARVSLMDGRTFELPQTVSADGARYANIDESFVFWNKGNGAMILENGIETDHKGCVILSSVSTEIRLSTPYVSTNATFSLRLPGVKTDTVDGYTINESFQNTLNPSTTISGVQFTIPVSVATGTNLSSDSYLSIEHIPNSETCDAEMFLDGAHATSTLVENGITYSVASSTNAGAGNRYEETIYVVKESNPCVAVRNLIHYTVLDNHASGTVTEFDELSLKAVFDQIRQTIIFNF
jgi:membrane-bound inhibitor of C-type lysozyme